MNVAHWPPLQHRVRTQAELSALEAEVDRLGAAAQYGWGHTIDFGQGLRKEGLFGEHYLLLARHYDEWGWWRSDLTGLVAADIGCYTGGMAALMAARGATLVHAVDEIPEHVQQCALVARELALPAVRPLCASLYNLPGQLPEKSLDVIVLSGVLYHLSDMLVGLHALRQLLKPGAVILIESAAVDEPEASYANFGRFLGGAWWIPTSLCIRDMLEFMGYAEIDLRFYAPDRCVVRAISSSADQLTFRRGMNWSFDSLRDARARSVDYSQLAPAPVRPASRPGGG